MGKSAKMMRTSAHEKQKRVLKGKDWKDSGLKLARQEHKDKVRAEKAMADDLMGGGPAGAAAKKNPLGGMADKLKAVYAANAMAQGVEKGTGGPGSVGQKKQTAKQAAVQRAKSHKVKVGKIQFRNNVL